MIDFGIPTLIENRTLEDNIYLCKELGLNMTTAFTIFAKELAHFVGYSEYHFIRLFKKFL